ncbi:apolipoprotein L3-like [Clarias gariepinus]|uniref:apolipoprotein L3-like n=1 Tax=Clarias gariepinus TaxID=13013 RepID=UPI00234D1568|nr:apolipoprotein L3-like [Clarias gariepinus]
MNESFRLTFLFGLNAQDFINIFSERRSRMFQFLSDLEKAATKLDKMKKGFNISNVAGSSLGIAGSICSIIGLALAPVSAGVSLGLTLTGAGLGVTSGITGLVTSITETAVNIHQGQKANNIFIRFMKDIDKLLDIMGQVGGSEPPAEFTFGVNLVHEGRKLGVLGKSVAQDIVEFVDVTSGLQTIKNEEAIARTAKIGLKRIKTAQNFPAHAVNLPDVGQMAKGGLSKSGRVSFITVNAFFIGVDVFVLYRDIQNLSEGSNSNETQLIRSRSALWCSEVEAWEKIFKHLCEGISTFDKNLRVLQQPFHM